MRDPRLNKPHRGRYQARKLYSLEGKRCQGGCGKPAAIRHHKNGNPHDNGARNIQLLCRACHVRLDPKIIPH
jgi:hypothetical protein